MGDSKTKLTALLITYNEIFHIDAVLDNISFADEIIVIDSFSTDGTAEKVRERPEVQLIQRPFKNFTDQKSFALEQASNDWVLFLDADERVTAPLQQEIIKTINLEKAPANAYFFKRTFMFKSEILHFSGWQSDKNYRLFRKSKVYFSE
ncbi:MAG: glycosyltransferase family 2 protein, partial [Pricia sp.]